MKLALVLGKYIKYVKENPNHLLLKTINTFQKFDLKFKIFYLTKKQKKYLIKYRRTSAHAFHRMLILKIVFQ